MKPNPFRPALPAFLIAVLAGCASAPTAPPPPAIPGYTFGYRVSGDLPAQVVSDAGKTWITLPPDASLQQAEGDGRYVPFKRHGAYWVADGVATRWTLYTDRGPVQAYAPDTVGVMLAAQRQAEADQPHYRQLFDSAVVSFPPHGIRPDAAGEAQLTALAQRLSAAHKIERVIVSGHTTGSAPTAENTTLGAARAAAVKTWLIGHGIAPVYDIGWSAGNGATASVLASYEADPKAQAKAIQVATADQSAVSGGGPHVSPVAAAGGSAPSSLPGSAAAGSASGAAIHPAPEKTVPAEKEWHLRVGESLRDGLARWCRKDGWTLQWNLDFDYRISVPVTLHGSLVQAVTKIMDAYRARGAMTDVQAQFLKGNRVLAIARINRFNPMVSSPGPIPSVEVQ